MKPHLQEECLGVSVIYLGGLNFMFNVHEKSLPIVSGIGNVLGEMEIEIITLFHNPELYLKEKDRDLKVCK
jgi:hypothetical protein